jgi:DNA repair protein RadC
MCVQSLRDKLTLNGPKALADSEIVALLMGREVEDGARLLVDMGGLIALSRCGVRQLADATDRVLACRLQAAMELGRRAVDQPLDRGPPIRSAADVWERMRGRLAGEEREELHVLGLDAHNRVQQHFIAGLGTVHQVQVDPRDVFRPLVREAAHSAIVVHNHPTGEPTPSPADAELTTRLAAAGKLVGVQLLDHVVVARSGYFSFSAPDGDGGSPTELLRLPEG